MANKVFMGKEGFIHNVYEGDQTYETVSAVVSETLTAQQLLRAKGKPVKILVDLSKIGKTTAGSRKASTEALRSLAYEKIALYGANLFLKQVSNFLIRMSGKGSKVRYFDTREEAAAWLAL